jgi:hypothetical protein
MRALVVTDPVVPHDPAADDAMLARILAEPVEAPQRRPRRRARRVALMVGVPLAAASAAFTWAQLGVDDTTLKPLIADARRDIPLPPGAQWSPIPEQILGPASRTSPEMASEIALSEAQCHWERYWIDSLGRPGAVRAAAAGFDEIVARMRGVPGMAEVVTASSRAGAAARAGDTSLLRRDLAVNCAPEAGGSATTLSVLELSLSEAGRSAVALVMARPAAGTLPTDAEALGFQGLVERTVAALRRAGLAPDPDDAASTVTGRDYLTAVFHVADPGRAAAVVRSVAAAQAAGKGSFLLVWRGPRRSERIPLGG